MTFIAWHDLHLIHQAIQFVCYLWCSCQMGNLCSCWILIVKLVFFNCYLAAPRPSLGHYWGVNLTHSMLITEFWPEGQREPRNELRSLSSSGVFWTGNIPILIVTAEPTRPLSTNVFQWKNPRCYDKCTCVFFLKQGNTRYKELNIKLNKETKNGKGKSWYMMQD